MSQQLKAGGQVVVRWCCPQDDDCAPTVTVAVDVKLQLPSDESSTVDLSGITATVVWGGGSCAVINCGPDCQSEVFDVVNGGALSVVAFDLTVTVNYPGQPSAAHPPVLVDISVGIGTSGKAGIAASGQKTVFLGTLTAGNPSAPTRIPEWAVDAILVSANIATATAIFRQYAAPGGLLVSEATVGKNVIANAPIARGRGARYFTVDANLTDAAIIFDLGPN